LFYCTFSHFVNDAIASKLWQFVGCTINKIIKPTKPWTIFNALFDLKMRTYFVERLQGSGALAAAIMAPSFSTASVRRLLIQQVYNIIMQCSTL